MNTSMRWLRLAAPAAALAVWLVASFAQQQAPPPAPRPPAEAPEAPQEERPPATPPAADDEDDDTFIPTEELQPDAAVTFPVDI